MADLIIVSDHGTEQYLNIEQRIADRSGQFIAPFLVRFFATIRLYTVTQQIAQWLQ